MEERGTKGGERRTCGREMAGASTHQHVKVRVQQARHSCSMWGARWRRSEKERGLNERAEECWRIPLCCHPREKYASNYPHHALDLQCISFHLKEYLQTSTVHPCHPGCTVQQFLVFGAVRSDRSRHSSLECSPCPRPSTEPA